MTDDSEFCGMEIKRCAKIVAIIGIILSVCTFDLIGFVIYVFVYLGVDNNKPAYLLIAKICLLTFLVLTIIVLILIGFLIVIGIIVLQDSEVQSYLNDNKSMEDDLVITKLKLNALKVVITFFAVCINFCYMIISYIAVSKARRFMLNDSSNQFHVNNPGESKYVYVQP